MFAIYLTLYKAFYALCVLKLKNSSSCNSQSDQKAEALMSICIFAIFPLLIIRETEEQWQEKKVGKDSAFLLGERQTEK